MQGRKNNARPEASHLFLLGARFLHLRQNFLHSSNNQGSIYLSAFPSVMAKSGSFEVWAYAKKNGLVVRAATVSRIMRGYVMALPFPLSNRATGVRPDCKTQRIAPTLRQVADLMCAHTKEREYYKTCIVGHVNCCLQFGPTFTVRYPPTRAYCVDLVCWYRGVALAPAEKQNRRTWGPLPAGVARQKDPHARQTLESDWRSPGLL
ncbi:hypothetical protein PoB_005127100 [Plakobranchus ocellatus]|uniref:Uncharacterized protein n=1 Tax=Plakobranchus ocellatus TaxID=259542 RepID=A0AAV4C076_9GAST|nr:hypothetical protein PoB_005127100 [Plakobranchus ocellatus]